MQSIQELFSRAQELGKERRSIQKEYKDLLSHDAEYQTLVEELKEKREKKKLIETHAQETMGSRYARFEEVRDEIAELKQMISDIAMTQLMKGEPIEVADEENTLYEPQFTVNFKKTGAKKIEEEN